MGRPPIEPDSLEVEDLQSLAPADLAITCYADLRAIAGSLLRGAPADLSISATGAVHEAVVRVMARDAGTWRSRSEFVAYGAATIRSVLVDHARRRLAAKRGGGSRPLSLEAARVPVELTDQGIIELDEALASLRALSERQHRVVELRFFGQMSVTETAAILGVSEATVKSDWRCARAWLAARVSGVPRA